MSSILNRIANYQHSLSTKQNSFKSIVGVVQLCATEDIDANFEKCSRLVEECADKGAQMVCLPEHFAYMTQSRNDTQGFMYNFDDKLNAHLFQKYKQLALDN